ncbi:MAG: NAD-dependent succinate-semialdehyde dehydrogenase [Neisseriaceae bacterium]|nr:NAD-dependent succinate-semialdehyde dehydrogenase [Neisseriaceae bacterium]MBP6862013.1 NAD-dependent succinate-semialdehyde dehydrogenase [Neisseriaceae bacterium]
MLLIDHEWREASSGARFNVTNPATGAVLDTVADATETDALAAVASAQAAFKSWSKQTAYARSQVLYRAYELMLGQKEALAKLMTEEQGKPLKAARNEVQYAADFLLWFAEEAKRVYGEVIPSARADQRFITLKQPVGVVVAITPWNYPISMITRKLAPALAAGCTVVLKPAEETPLCARAVVDILREAGLPAGVVNVVNSSQPEVIGEVLLSHPQVKKITFTGSTEVGKAIAAKAALQVKSVSMELGGHAPFIVCADADPEHAAKGLALVKFLNTGQACISPNRVFVHRSLLTSFVATLVQRTQKLKAGNGLDDGVSIGPLVSEAALAKVAAQVEDAKAKGATVLLGGQRLSEGGLDRGHYYAPTILTDVTPDMLIYREETFGPVAAIIGFDDEDDVIEMANDTQYGLAAYVYTHHLGRALHAFEDLNFGIIGINDINPTAAAAPFGGVNESGLGREGGQEGIEAYLQTKLGGFSI